MGQLVRAVRRSYTRWPAQPRSIQEKTVSQKWASDDDAEGLLAGILDETEDVARAEKERLEAEMRAKEEEEKRRAEEEERKRREEAEARLTAERERLEKVEERRTQKMEALRVEELKERGEWVDPEEIARKEAEEAAKREAEAQRQREERAKEQAALMAAQQAHSAANSPAEQQSSNKGLIIGAVVALVLVVGAGVTIVALTTGYTADSATYTKTVFTPKEVEVAMVEAGFTPIPKAEPEAEKEEKTMRTRRTRRSRPSTSTRTRKPAKSKKSISNKPKQNEASKRLEEMLEGGDDVFGM